MNFGLLRADEMKFERKKPTKHSNNRISITKEACVVCTNGKSHFEVQTKRKTI